MERVRRQVRDATHNDISHTIREGKRGENRVAKPNQDTKDAWGAGTVRNNARNLRILAGETEGLDDAVFEGKYEVLEWDEMEGRDDYPDRLLDFDEGEHIVSG